MAFVIAIVATITTPFAVDIVTNTIRFVAIAIIISLVAITIANGIIVNTPPHDHNRHRGHHQHHH